MGTRIADIWRATSDALLGKPDLSGLAVRSMAGMDAAEAKRLWQALGFPSVSAADSIFTKRDVDALSTAMKLMHGNELGHELLLPMARATGQALSRVAHMHVLSVAEQILQAARDEQLSNAEAADRVAELSESLVRDYEPFLAYIWRRHLVAAISQTVANGSGPAADAEVASVGFADLVGFTAITGQVSERELIEIVDRFEKIAYQEIPERGGRVIKTVGDQVMFSNPSAEAAASTALALASSCRDDEVLPDVRVGIAVGSMLAWEGDLYGPTVNLANRLAGIASPGTVIISDEMAERLSGNDQFRLVEIRNVKLKGIGRTKPWVLRWSSGEEKRPR